MTSQQIGDRALALYQANRKSPEIEILLDEFFGRIPTAEDADRIQSRVSEIFACPEITGSPSPSPSSALS